VKLLPFDTETTGIPIWSTPSGNENQPHMVQLAAMLVDSETKEIVESMDVIIKPYGWVIPKTNTVKEWTNIIQRHTHTERDTHIQEDKHTPESETHTNTEKDTHMRKTHTVKE